MQLSANSALRKCTRVNLQNKRFRYIKLSNLSQRREYIYFFFTWKHFMKFWEVSLYEAIYY